MRQKDKVEKLLEDYPDVFADIINVLIYAISVFSSQGSSSRSPSCGSG